MPILNYTTTIDAFKTLGEIQKILVRSGARSINVDYDDDGNPSAVTFLIDINGTWINFRLPSNWHGVKRRIDRDPNIRRGLKTDEQAIRVSWRITKDWIEAQMAIIDAELAELAEVFLPYAVRADGQTFYRAVSGNLKLLEG